MRSRPLPIVVAAFGALVLGACGDEPTADAEAFCAEAVTHTNSIVDPPIDDEAGLAATLDFYHRMGDLAPLSIAEEWNQLVVALETAAELEPGNPESEQLVAATAYASEGAAYDVKVWLARNCGLDIPITTIAPHDRVDPVVSTTTPTVTTP